MYIDYTGLWKLLAEKGMTKSDLIELTGLSSRVISKLSKNDTVTTDTLVRICDALGCRLSDIAECESEDRMTFFEAYNHSRNILERNEAFTVSELFRDGKRYLIYKTNETATKATHIECRPDRTIYRVKFYMFGGIGGPSRIESVLLRPISRSGEVIIVVIKGKPGLIAGLDEGIFVSSRGKKISSDSVFVMSEGAFKLFEPRNAERDEKNAVQS